MTVLQSPRRLRAKYTPRTNLRFVLWVFRPCGEPVSQLRTLPRKFRYRGNCTAISIAVPPITDSCDSRTRQVGCVMSTVFPAEKGAKGWQDIRLFRCRSCPMSREESHISRATQNRKTFTPPIVPPTIPFGKISPGKVSRSSSEAEHQESVSKQGS